MMNKYNSNIHHRRSIRLKGYDYSQAGLYFITICIKNRECLFGNIIKGELILNDAGQMIKTEWFKLPQRFKNIQLHEYIVMPNHFHAILEIVGATLVVAPNNNIAPNNDIGNNIANQNIGGNIAPNNDIGNNIANQNIGGNIAPNNDIGNNIAPNNDIGNNIAPNNDIGNNIAPNNDIGNNFANQNIGGKEGQPQGIAPTGKTVGDMVGAFESITTVEYIRGVKQKKWQPFDGKLWQRNYWEHIIRNEKSYQNISEYIINNPLKWENDKFNTHKKRWK